MIPYFRLQNVDVIHVFLLQLGNKHAIRNDVVTVVVSGFM